MENNIVIRSKYKHYVIVGCLSGMAMMLSGCSADKEESHPIQPITTVSPSPTQANVSSQETSRPNPVVSCQKTLDSLQVVNPSAWKRHKAEFDTLIRSASQYGAVRDGVSDKTKDTVDAMYQFRTSKICSDIENEVMDALISHGEKAAR